jgi:hypothetical protein
MNSKELQRWLKKQGCTFEADKGGGGHITVKLGTKANPNARQPQGTWQRAGSSD